MGEKTKEEMIKEVDESGIDVSMALNAEHMGVAAIFLIGITERFEKHIEDIIGNDKLSVELKRNGLNALFKQRSKIIEVIDMLAEITKNGETVVRPDEGEMH